LRDEIVAELSQAHPDLAAKVTQMDITRYGHAMAVPAPQMEKYIGCSPRGMDTSSYQNQSVSVSPIATGQVTRY
jgi:hypothetical protein